MTLAMRIQPHAQGQHLSTDMGDGHPEQKLLRITLFLLRPHDAPHDAYHKGNDQDDPDDHVNWSVSAVA